MGHDHRDDKDLTRASVPGRGDSGAAPSVPGRTTLGHRLPFGPPRPPADPLAQVEGSTGAPLPADLSGELEGALGTSVGDVRVHTGAAAAGAAEQLGAQAFAVGSDVYFGAGQYDPSSTAGKSLIAHEVAHTVQQRGAAPVVQGKHEVSTPGDAHETEADNFAASFVAAAGRAAPISPVSSGAVQRKMIARQAAPPAAPATPTTPTTPAGPAPAQREHPDIFALEEQLDLGSNAVESMFDHQANGANEVADNLRETDPPSFGEELLITAAAMALGGGAGALAQRIFAVAAPIVARYGEQVARVLEQAIRDAIKDGIKTAASRIAGQIRGRSGRGQSLGSFVAAQKHAIIEMKRLAKNNIVRVKTRVRRAAASGDQQRLASDIEAASLFTIAVEALNETAHATQYQATLAQWMSIQAQGALGSVPAAGRNSTDLSRAVNRSPLWATHHAPGVIYVRVGRQSQHRPFVARGGISLEGSTESVRTNPALASTPVRDLGMPIVTLASMYHAPNGGMSSMTFGRNEAGTIYVEGDAYAQRLLRQAAGANDTRAAAETILNEDVGRMTLGSAS